MSAQDHADRVWDIIESASVGMLTTRFAGGLRARPLEARPDRDGGFVWFLMDARSGKDDEIGQAPDIGLVFINAHDKAYLSITGSAEIVRDLAKARSGSAPTACGGAAPTIRICVCSRLCHTPPSSG